jgi:aspartate-semialdehyde dehydrogenase
MTAVSKIDVAVVGAASLIGAAVIEEMRATKFPYSQIFRLEELRDIGRMGDDENAEASLDIEQFDFARVQLVFFCGRSELAQRHAKEAATHAWVLDGSSAHREALQIPLVAAEVNPKALAGLGPRGLVSLPGSASVALATALAPLHAAVPLSRIDVATYHCVSGGGRAALEELAREAAALLNGQEPKLRPGGSRIAFNVIPQIDALDEHGDSLEEHRMRVEAQRLLARPGLPVNVTAVRVPVFFGHGLAVHAAFEPEMTLEMALTALRSAPGIQVVEAAAKPPYPTPAGKSLASDKVYVGRLRQDRTRPGALNLWIVADNVRKCAAINAVQVALILVNAYC